MRSAGNVSSVTLPPNACGESDIDVQRQQFSTRLHLKSIRNLEARDKTAFLAAIAVTVCTEWAMADERAHVKTDKLIRRRLKVLPLRSGKVTKTRPESDRKKTCTCPSADILPVVRPKTRSLLQKSP
jgi:hypothetical protein